ncbi:hypothetical protein RUM43_000284 [Polyplax serrata]|uniref:Uncharacterized protein n=1 Tax=Polyplax serrata TaxID=468196 RepID=A0AAN8XNB8_POLSC
MEISGCCQNDRQDGLCEVQFVSWAVGMQMGDQKCMSDPPLENKEAAPEKFGGKNFSRRQLEREMRVVMRGTVERARLTASSAVDFFCTADRNQNNPTADEDRQDRPVGALAVSLSSCR